MRNSNRLRFGSRKGGIDISSSDNRIPRKRADTMRVAPARKNSMPARRSTLGQQKFKK
jgi:hypothetical protein